MSTELQSEEFLSNMNFEGKIVVISGDGLLGKALRLETYACDNFVFSTRRNTSDFQIDANEFRKFDFSGAISIIYNLQSSFYKSSNLNKEDLDIVNYQFPKMLAEYCHKNSIHFTYLSTGSVYKPSPHKLDEKCELVAPQEASPYVLSKLKAEAFMAQYNNVLILRPFFLVGSYSPDSSLVKTLIRKINLNETIFLQGEDGVTFTFTSVNYAARAIVELVKLQSTGIFNLAGDLDFSILELSNRIAKILGRDLHVEVIDKAENLVANSAKLKLTLPNISTPSYEYMDLLLQELCEIELSES